MKDILLEKELVAATPYSDHTNTFVKHTMQILKRQQLSGYLPKKTWGFRLRHLSAPAFIALAVLVIVAVSGAVYATVQFAPALLQILGKNTNSRGATEYSVTGFAACISTNQQISDRFEIKSEAPHVSDDDVKKILQARCELEWINGFVKDTWPSYGTHAQWRDGDTIYYTRTDILDQVKSIHEHSLELANSSYAAFNNDTLRAFEGGNEIPLSSIKPDDTVFSIVRVSEIYHDLSLYKLKPDSTNIMTIPTTEQPKTLGAVGVFKLSLPARYYGEMQNYITEIPKCAGNEQDYCARTPSIDVYPRNNGEASGNPYAHPTQNSIAREISGKVTQLDASTLTLESTSGAQYHVAVGDNGFEAYNQTYAKNYDDIDAMLRIGSNVVVAYVQPQGADPKTISKDQVMSVGLMLEALNIKKGDITQY